MNDLEADADGNLYVSDSGDLKGAEGAVYKIAADGKVTTLVDASNPKVKTPNGLLLEDADHLLVLDFGSGELNRLTLKDGELEKDRRRLLEGGDGLVDRLRRQSLRHAVVDGDFSCSAAAKVRP